MAKDNKPFWKYFEQLAYEYVSYLYKDDFIKEQQHTTSSHDSGYDGLWKVLIQNEPYYQEVLMEAKYRKTQSSLPLSDCAKAIIIAFNLNVNTLYIATNIAFAPQTIEQISKYNERSNLVVVCINNDLKDFILTNKEYLISDCDIASDFLDEILASINKKYDKRTEKNFIQKASEEYFQDEYRVNMIKEIFNCLQSIGNCCMLSGNEGVGKTVLANAVKEKLLKNKIDVYTIDLSLCTSFRVLYLSVLEGIWGVSLHTILEDKKLCEYIEQLVIANNVLTDASISNAVKHIFATNYCDYTEHKDNYINLLLEYLDCILSPKKEPIRLAFFFENVNMLSPEVIENLLLLVNSLKKNGIRVLLEVRTPFLIDESDIPKSNFYFKQFQKISCHCFQLETIESNIASDYIQRNSDFSRHVCENLANFLGNNFLEIHSSLQVLKYQNFNNLSDIEKMNDMELEDYWETCGLSSNTIIVSLITRLRKCPTFNSIFELANLLNGNISFQIMEQIFGDKTKKYIEQAMDSTVFQVVGEKLKCTHLKYLKAIKKTSQPYEQICMAKQLLPIVQKSRDGIANYYIELNLLYILDKKEDIPICTLKVITLFIDDRQYKSAIETAIKYCNYSKQNDDRFEWNDNYLLQILLYALQCIRELHLDNEKDYVLLYDLTKTHILLEHPDVTCNKNWYRYMLLVWHKEFISGNFEKAYRISEELFKELQQISTLFDEHEDYIGQIYNAHGLSIKMVYGGEVAENFFEEGVNKYPNSYFAQAALLSQVANRLLKTTPKLAYKKYMKLLDITKGKEYPFQEILHTRIDIAMASFLDGNFGVAIEWAKKSVNIASSIGIYAQSGRAFNIWGCCLASQDLLEESINKFRESCTLLSIANAIIYMWRAQLNLASLLLAIGDKNEAFHILDEVLCVLQMHFMTKIQVDKESVPFQSLLVILMYLKEKNNSKKINEILETFCNTSIKEDFLKLSKNKNWKEVFHNKVICYNNIVLITG